MAQGSLGKRAGNTIVNANNIGKRTATVDLANASTGNLSGNGDWLGTGVNAVAEVRCDSNENYWITFAIEGARTSGSSSIVLTITGIDFDGDKNVTGRGVSLGTAVGGTGNISIGVLHAATTRCACEGTIPLSGKPSWFDANAESGNVDVYIAPADDTNPGTLNAAPSGVYTPTGTTNNASVVTTANITERSCHWIKINNIVQITGRIMFNAASAGMADIYITLPTSATSVFTTIHDVSGFVGAKREGTGANNASGQTGYVEADTSNNAIRLVAPIENVGDAYMGFSVGYEIKE